MSDLAPSPDYRALGQARLAAGETAETAEDWVRVFQAGTRSPFAFGPFWKLYLQYQVDDLAAEIGFFVDTLGLEASICCAEQVVLTTSDRDFHFSIVPTPERGQPTPPDSLLLSFMIQQLDEAVTELEKRGVLFDALPAPVAEGDPMSRAACRTPNGIQVELWEFKAPLE